MDRVRRISEEIVKKHPDLFGTDYGANKQELEKIALIRSKMLRNKIAGYITKTKNAESSAESEVVEAPEA
jgi:small subunit ribosomal protein S17e